MNIQRIYAQLACSSLSVSAAWFAKLFGRTADEEPMSDLAEWHHKDCAGLQLFEDAANAGHGTLTIVVQGLAEERARLVREGLQPGEIEPATSFHLVLMRDPDNNLVVLAQPK